MENSLSNHLNDPGKLSNLAHDDMYNIINYRL